MQAHPIPIPTHSLSCDRLSLVNDRKLTHTIHQMPSSSSLKWQTWWTTSLCLPAKRPSGECCASSFPKRDPQVSTNQRERQTNENWWMKLNYRWILGILFYSEKWCFFVLWCFCVFWNLEYDRIYVRNRHNRCHLVSSIFSSVAVFKISLFNFSIFLIRFGTKEKTISKNHLVQNYRIKILIAVDI